MIQTILQNQYRSLKFVFRGIFTLLLISNLAWAQINQEDPIPEYLGFKTLIQLGNPQIITEGESRKLSEKLNTFQAQTDWEAGILIVDNFENYRPIWEDFLEAVREKGYTPNGLLLVVAAENRKTHLFTSPELENAGKWELKYSNYIQDTLLLNEFRAGNFYEGLSAFVDYSGYQITDKNWFSNIGLTLTMFVIPFLFFNPLGWIILVVLFLVFFFWIKKLWYIRRIRQVYEQTLQLYQADLIGLKSALNNPELLNAGNKRLKEFSEKVEQFFEQRQRTYKEAKKLYEEAESLENEFTEFVNNPEKWDQKITEKKDLLQSKKDEIEHRINSMDL